MIGETIHDVGRLARDSRILILLWHVVSCVAGGQHCTFKLNTLPSLLESHLAAGRSGAAS